MSQREGQRTRGIEERRDKVQKDRQEHILNLELKGLIVAGYVSALVWLFSA